jgi:hypothetical protein
VCVQEVCAVSRRASAAGPALLVNFNPYARTSLTGVSPAIPTPTTEHLDGVAADGHKTAAGAGTPCVDEAVAESSACFSTAEARVLEDMEEDNVLGVAAALPEAALPV